MNIIIEEIVNNVALNIEEVISTVVIEISEMQVPGADGKSAYQSALDGGFVGTEAEFNTFLSEIGTFATVSELDTKLNIADYNDRFKGVYLNETALIAAYPTATAGDQAQVNEVGATDVVNYSWDAEENIWVNNGTGGSGAVNTDALPEGTSNLYFTTSRVLNTLLSGISFLTGTAITATDSILIALGKLQKQITTNDSASVHLAGDETITGKKTLTPTLTATANNQVLVGLDINPTFNNGAFTGVTNLAASINGSTSISGTGTQVPLTLNAPVFSNNTMILKHAGPYNAIQLNNNATTPLESGVIGWGNLSAYTLLQNSFYFLTNTGNIPTASTRFARFNGINILIDGTFSNNGNFLLGGITDITSKLYVTGNSVLNGNVFSLQPMPAAANATATLTIANLLTNIITSTNTVAVSLTLPTGTLTDAGILGGLLPVNNGFDWYLINNGTVSGIVTILAGTNHTIVGSAIVGIGASAGFRTVKTATNTFVTYRIK